MTAVATRLLLVDDHELFRESLARLLGAETNFEVAASCGSAVEALDWIQKDPSIEVVLLDFDLGSGNASVFLDGARGAGFHGRILLVTAGVEEGLVPSLVRRGVSGIFLKHGSPADLVRGIQETAQGRVFFDQAVLRKALEGKEDDSRQAPQTFTERERLVMSAVLEGLSNKQIGTRLEITEAAAKASLQQLFGKTGVRSRSQLVRVALERYRHLL